MRAQRTPECAASSNAQAEQVHAEPHGVWCEQCVDLLAPLAMNMAHGASSQQGVRAKVDPGEDVSSKVP